MTITVKEAIKVLETMLAGIDKQPFTYDVEKTLAVAVTGEALRMAIEKLKENCS